MVDATGKWVLPGMVDVHTHYDVEVLNGPGLPESVRHGVTTVLLGSCSLSTIHVGGTDAGDLFGRVEAIPREHVVDAIDTAKTWNSAPEYVEALESRPLGAERRGVHRPLRHAHRHHGTGPGHPIRRAAHLERAGRDGADAARCAGCRFRRAVLAAVAVRQDRRRDLPLAHPLPSTYAKPRELRRLKSLVRKRGWCCSPARTSRTR